MELFDIKYLIKTQFFGYARELQLNTKALLKDRHQPEKKFLILSTGRSGSTLLINFLNSSPNVHCEGELLRSKNIAPKRVIRLSEQACPKQVFGFKLLTYQLLQLQPSISSKKEFLSGLIADGYKIIYLERKNSLLQAFSIIYAMQRNIWHYKNESTVEHSKITLDPKKLATVIQECEKFKVLESTLLENLPYLYINYEEDLQPKEKIFSTLQKLETHLGVPLQEPVISLKKVTPKKLSSFLNNYKEISNFILSQKQYEQFTEPIIDSLF